MILSALSVDTGRNLGRAVRYWMRLFAASLLLSLGLAAPGRAHDNIPIFVLHAYSQEYPWTKRQHEGYMRKLEAAFPEQIAASVEYLDTKRMRYTDEYAEMYARYLERKYAGYQPKLIYATDDNALLFALQHLARIFPEVPVFFSGVNDYFMQWRIDSTQMVGVFEQKEIAPNLELVRRLVPDVRDILIVGDESETYEAIRRDIVAELDKLPGIRAHFVSSNRIDLLTAQLRRRNERFVFLTTLGAMTDAEGRLLTLPEIIGEIVRAGRFVVLSMEDVYLHPGVLGGYVTSGDKQGASAAALSASFLHGTRIPEMNSIIDSPNEYLFDGREIEKLGLVLPKDIAAQATIVNAPQTFYQENQTAFLRALFVLGLLLFASILISHVLLMRKNRQISGALAALEAHAEQLRSAQQRLAQAERIAGVGSWEWTLADGVITWSEGLNVMLGRAPEAAAPSFDEVSRFYTKESWERLEAAIALATQAGEPYDLELEMLCSDNSSIWTATRGEVVRAADGAVVKLRGTVHDIDARKKMEDALRQSEERYRTLIDWTPEAIAVHREGILLYVNPACARMLGAGSAAELIGKRVLDFVHPDFRAVVMARVQKAVREGVAAPPMEERFVRLDGKIIDVEAQNTSIVFEGKPAIQVAVRDVTERNLAEAARAQLEAQLRESQKMEALGTLAGGVAHDFNNALAAIVGNAALARQDVGADHPALESLVEIEKASRRAKDIVEQILAFGRRQKFDRKVTSLALVVVESARLLRASLPVGVQLAVECKPDAPAVRADATQIKQVLLNLCANAVHAVEASGYPGVVEIRLEAHKQLRRKGELLPGDYACIIVRDNGLGMDEETRAHIFEPFFTTKPVGKGTGLGLAVVHSIVKAHDAVLNLETEPGQGAEFRIYFPAAEATAEEGPAPRDDTAPGKGEGQRVLYVDDEQAIIFLMTRLLERQGYRVSGYTDPREALEAVRSRPDDFDLAVTDYNMPQMSGLEVATALRELRPDLPVLLASGYITEELRQKAPAAGICELVYKPNTVDELCAAVARFARAQGRHAAASQRPAPTS